MPQVPVVFQSYQSRSAPFSNQRLLNMYAEAGTQGTKTPVVLYNRPGLATFAHVGDGPVRGIESFNGIPHVVSGDGLYRLDADGSSERLGTVPGTECVNMANNGRQIVIVSDGNAYVLSPPRSGMIESVVDESQTIAITSVIDNGNGNTRFITDEPHGVLAGQTIEHVGFGGVNHTYNGTFKVTSVRSDVSYDITQLPYMGELNRTSLLIHGSSISAIVLQITSDGTTLWGFSESGEINAYNLETRERDESKDFSQTQLGLTTTNILDIGLWSDGITLYVSDETIVRAYNIATKARDTSKDITLVSHSRASGLTSDGTTLWVADSRGTIYAYNLETRERDESKDISTPYSSISIAIYDGHIYVSIDILSDLAAYNIETKSQDEDLTISRIADLDRHQLVGIVAVGDVLYVSQPETGNVNGYRLSPREATPEVKYSVISINSRLHGMNNGEEVIISGTDSYNGEFEIFGQNLNTFRINTPYVADETGSWNSSDTLVSQITDEGFPSVNGVTFQKGYFVWSISESNDFQLSPLYNGTGPYDQLDRFSAEYNPDDLVAVFSDHDDLILMGSETIEPWFNSGALDAPFSLNQGSVMEVGVLARDSVQRLDNSIFWLGNSGERGGVTVWRANGYTPVRVSTHALEAQWESYGDISDARAITFRHEGHAFYVLTIPDRGTFIYDASTGLWCEWERFGKNDWDVSGYANAYNRNLLGSASDGTVFSAGMETYSDDGDPIVREGICPVIATENNELAIHDFIRLDMEAGVGDNIEPRVSLQWADEDGMVFNDLKYRDVGKVGERRERVFWRRLGQARSRTYKFRITDPVKTAIYGAYAMIRPLKW